MHTFSEPISLAKEHGQRHMVFIERPVRKLEGDTVEYVTIRYVVLVGSSEYLGVPDKSSRLEREAGKV